MSERAARELVECALHNDAEQVKRPKKKKEEVEEKEVVFSDEETDAKKVKTDAKNGAEKEAGADNSGKA